MLVARTAAGADWTLCGDCKLQLGAGATYHYWGATAGLVLPVTVLLDGDRYELGAFRMATGQHFYDRHFNEVLQTATPYWGFSASRRWNLLRRPYWRLVLGLGGSYKTQENDLSSTRWNFAEQLGLRLTPNGRLTLELTFRHWSNAGLKLPNRGQDFATLSFVVLPGAFGR